MMKKSIFFLFFIGLLLIPLALLAQEPTVPPVSWGEVFSNPALWLGSFAGVSLLTAFITAFAIGLLKLTSKLAKQFVAWGIAIVITTLVGSVFNFKLVYTWELPVLLAALHGFMAGLASNGWAKISVLKEILDSITGLFKKPDA